MGRKRRWTGYAKGFSHGHTGAGGRYVINGVMHDDPGREISLEVDLALAKAIAANLAEWIEEMESERRRV